MSLVYDRLPTNICIRSKEMETAEIIAACLFMISSVVISIMAVTGKLPWIQVLSTVTRFERLFIHYPHVSKSSS